MRTLLLSITTNRTGWEVGVPLVRIVEWTICPAYTTGRALMSYWGIGVVIDDFGA